MEGEKLIKGEMKDYDRWFKIEMHQKEAGRYLFLVILENDRRYCGPIGNVFKNSSLMFSRLEICEEETSAVETAIYLKRGENHSYKKRFG